MTPDEIADLFIAHYGQSGFYALVDQFYPLLTLDVMAAFKQRVDDEKYDNPQKALEIAEAAQVIASRIATPESHALALWARSGALYHLCRYQDMLACCRQAETLYTELGQPLKAAAVQINQVVALRDMGEHQAALNLAQKARAVCEAMGDQEQAQRYLALLEMNVGAIYRQIGNLEAAIAAYQRGRAIFDALRDVLQIARTDINRAVVLEEMARFAEAQELLLSARSALEQTGQTQEIARANLNLGILAYRRGYYQPALRYLELAHTGFSAIPIPVDVAEVDLYRAFIYRDLNLMQETIALAAKAGHTFRQNALKWEQAIALTSQAAAYRQMGERGYAMADKLLSQARRIFYQQKAQLRVLQIDMERVSLMLDMGRIKTAGRLALRIEKQLAPNAWPIMTAQLDLLLARCALAHTPPRWESARQYTEQAIAIAETHSLSNELIAAHYLQGRLLEEAGDGQAACRQYNKAIQAIERLRAYLSLDEIQMSFMDDKLPIYEAAVRVTRSIASPAQVFYTLNLACAAPYPRLAERTRFSTDNDLQARLRELRERWHWLVAMNDYSAQPADDEKWRRKLQDVEVEIADLARRVQVRAEPLAADVPIEAEHITNTMAAETFLAQIQSRLSGQDVLLHYYLVDDQFQAALVTPSDIHLIANLAPVASMQRLRKSWRFHIEQAAHLGGTSQAAYLARLYESLLKPLEPYLTNCERIFLIVPPDWHDLPFAAFFDREKYLAERFQLAYLSAPGVILKDRLTAERNANPNALIVGYSDNGRLPYAVTEARQVDAALRSNWQTALLLEDDATLEHLQTAIPSSHLIHLATHATFRPSNPLFSWIRLADARLTVAELYEITLPQHPLVILSACETGRGQPKGGGLLGMGRGFLAAGASGLIVSLWPVADQASAQLMADLYAHLSLESPASGAAALQYAQKLAIARGEPPFGWAGFVFIGA